MKSGDNTLNPSTKPRKTIGDTKIMKWLSFYSPVARKGIVLAAFSILLQRASVGQGCPSPPAVYRYDPSASKVEGTLSKRQVFGPPGYGESPRIDSKAAIFVLKLRCPIDVEPECDAKAPYNSNLNYVRAITEIQLLLDGKDQVLFAKGHFGKDAVVRGKLEEGVTAGEYTKVTLLVEQLTPSHKRQDKK